MDSARPIGSIGFAVKINSTMNNPFNEEEGFQDGDAGSGGLIDTPNRESADQGQVTRKTEERSSVITARGTSDGLVLRVDGRVESGDLIAAVREFLESRRSFLSGNDIAFEWIGRRPEEGIVQKLTEILSSEFAVSVRASKQKNVAVPKSTQVEKLAAPEELASKEPPLSILGGGRNVAAKKTPTSPERTVSLFDGIDSYESRIGAANPMSWDEPDARIVYGTLRSGQKIESEHSIIVVGDVNSGAEVIAGGDVIILGTLRGIAHAGAYDESGGGRVIFSLNLRPTQLRIGLVISRGSGAEDAESTPRGGLPEVARVDGNMIVVEPYQSRTVWVRRRD